MNHFIKVLSSDAPHKSWKDLLLKDARAGLVVAIITLPMSMGIALASGFPPFAGLLSSFVGGFVLSFISGSESAIKGPTSGLCAITLSAVFILGNGDMATGYSYTLAAIVMAGILQIVSAFAKMGNLGNFFPSSVVHGMFAGLGFIMAVKQIPPILGSSSTSTDALGIIWEVPNLIRNCNPKIAFLGLGALVITLLYSFLLKRFSESVPAIIFTLSLGIPLCLILNLHTDHTYQFAGNTYEHITKQYMVYFPNNFIGTLQLPHFDIMGTASFWFFVVLFSFACNIESLLTCKAIDQIDSQHRNTDFNKDLLSIGLGNIICGLLGGLPLISESKRSMVNVKQGGQNISSNFFHALFLLFLVLILHKIINYIPISILSAFLIFMGIKMTLPKEFSKSYQIGPEQLLVFIVVFAITVKFNFLLGVLGGIVLEFLINMQFGAPISSFFKSNLKISLEGRDTYHVAVQGPAIFSNFIWAKKQLEFIPKGSAIVFDFSKAPVVDHSFMENLSHFDANRKQYGGTMSFKGLQYHTLVSEHPLAARRILQNESTHRHKELEVYAIESGFSYASSREIVPEFWEQFHIKDKIKILHAQNSLSCHIDDYGFEFFDVSVEINGVAHKQIQTTCLTISNLPPSMPHFMLQKEDFDEGIFDISHYKDINFKEFPSFSYYYYLGSREETKTRAYFIASRLIQFFESHRGYHVFSADGDVLIFKRNTLLDVQEMEKMVSFALDFVELIDTLSPKSLEEVS